MAEPKTTTAGAAVFGGFDGLVSVLGVIVGLLTQHATRPVLVAAVVGGAVCATASMASGEYLGNGSIKRAVVMGVGTAAGTVLPLLPFLLPLPETTATLTAGMLVALAGAVIAWMRPGPTLKSLAATYGLLIVAVGVTVAVVTVIPAAGG